MVFRPWERSTRGTDQIIILTTHINSTTDLHHLWKLPPRGADLRDLNTLYHAFEVVIYIQRVVVLSCVRPGVKAHCE